MYCFQQLGVDFEERCRWASEREMQREGKGFKRKVRG